MCAAPTGSGKTTLLDLAIVRMITTAPEPVRGQRVAVYMAPTKALCDERCADWSRRFGAVGLRCLELTGDTAVEDMHRAASADIVLTTPEKWDAVTRSWRENRPLARNLALVLIDEAHLINDKIRGATLEAVR